MSQTPCIDMKLAQRDIITLARLRVLLGLQPLTTTAYPLRVLRERAGERETVKESFIIMRLHNSP